MSARGKAIQWEGVPADVRGSRREAPPPRRRNERTRTNGTAEEFMAHSKQARKRIRQSEVRRIRNKSARSEIKTLTKSLEAKVAANDVEAAQTLLRMVTARLDKAAKRNVYHRNAVARRKSKASSLVRDLVAAPAAPAAEAE